MDLARIVLVIFAAVIVALPGAAQDVPLYVDENGEEIFGPDYLPVSASARSLPLYVAQPSTGRRIPDNLLTFTQEAFRPSPDLLALPIDDMSRQEMLEVPLLRNMREAFNRFQRVPPPPPPVEAMPTDGITPLAATQQMKVHYVFVGQGAGAIIELPCGVAVVDLGGEYDFNGVYGTNGKVDGGLLFENYLKDFMASHPQYNNTIDVVFLSHPHADHINGGVRLMEAAQPFKVSHFVDNGQTATTGGANKQRKIRDWALGQGADYTAIEFSKQVVASGVTNAGIDPFACANVSAFWGGLNDNVLNVPGYSSPNNHSVLVRLEFGAASFLFLGDIETDGIEDLLSEYDENLGALDVDVFQVSHHGSDGDTPDALLEVISPRMAVISMGTDQAEDDATAWAYGHPRRAIIDLMQNEPFIVSDDLDPPEVHPVAVDKGTPSFDPFVDTTISKAIIGTGWEGTLIVNATGTGEYEIEVVGFP
jgi:competence protein ComEC